MTNLEWSPLLEEAEKAVIVSEDGVGEGESGSWRARGGRKGGYGMGMQLFAKAAVWGCCVCTHRRQHV